MPVGTRATVKAVDPRELEQLGAQIILGNTYHLHFRPGAEVIAELGGLHRFMGWERPILTDSGGFQVFSLADTRKIDADGVTFRSVYDGSEARFTPELAMAVQADLGSDIAMAFDECRAGGRVARRPGERGRAHVALGRALRRRSAPDGQLRFGIVQGGIDRELRTRSAGHLTGLPFDGYAIGGLSVGEERELMFDVTASTAALLPAARPRYFMGIGDPEGILRVIGAGIDMFDCVLPTRLGRTGSATTWEGRLNLRNARFARDDRPAPGGLRMPGLHALLARLRAPSGDAGRTARPAAPDAAQPLLPARVVPWGTPCDHRAPLRRLRRGGTRATRLGDGAEHAGRGAGGAVNDAGITLVWIVGIALLTWFLFIRPRRRMMLRQRELLGALSTGDQVVTVGGVYGIIAALDGDEVRLEIAPDVVIRVARRAVVGRVGPPAAAEAEEAEGAE